MALWSEQGLKIESHIVKLNKKFFFYGMGKLCAFPRKSLAAFKLFAIHSTGFLLKQKALF